MKAIWPPFLLFLLLLSVGMLKGGDSFWALHSKTLSMTETILFYGVQIGIWLSAAHLLNRLLRVFFWDGFMAKLLGGPTPRLLRDVVGFLIFLVAITGIVGVVFGRSVTGIWATSGAIGLVIGLALRSIILDVFTGLAVNIDRPYKIGDWIMLHRRRESMHIVGKLIEINWRTTRIATKDGNILIVPNSLMGQSIITNFMVPDEKSRVEIFFVLDFSVPPERALRVLEAGAKAVCGQGPKSPLADPKPKIRIIRSTAHGVEYRVRFWVIPRLVSPGKGRHLITQSILNHLRQAGLTLAYPKQDVYYEQMPVRQLDASSAEDRQALLAKIELFQELQPQELAQLASLMARRQFDADALVIRQDDDGQSMFILVEGLLAVYIASEPKGDEEPEEMQVAQLIPGQFFGEMSLLTGEPRSATIKTLTEAVVYEITKEDLQTLLAQRPELAEQLSLAIAARKARAIKEGSGLDDDDLEKETEGFMNQVLGKMKSFFGGVFG